MLTKAGYPRLIVKREGREMYLDALRHGNEGWNDLLVSTFVELLIDNRAKLFESIVKSK